MSDYGISKLAARRVIELIKEYRYTLHQLELDKKREYPTPLDWTIEQEEIFIDGIISEIDKNKVRIKDKLEKVCENALIKLDIVSTVTVTENRYGRIRILAECPVCHQYTDLAEAISYADGNITLRCTECGATRVRPVG